MAAFTKLFSDIVRSTIWREPNHVRIVWITMLAIAERDGLVESSLPGLADLARVSLPECEEALKLLGEPDPYSRSTEFDGRRVRAVDSGWLILNYEKYRNRLSCADRREYQRVKQVEYRKRRKGVKVEAQKEGAREAINDGLAEPVAPRGTVRTQGDSAVPEEEPPIFPEDEG